MSDRTEARAQADVMRDLAKPADRALCELLVAKEKELMHRTLGYARDLGYAKYTSTLEEAWRASITGLNEALIREVCSRDGRRDWEIVVDEELGVEPSTAFGIQEADLHRSRGVTLAQFLGLTKYYRQAYMDMLDAGDDFDEADQAEYRYRIGRFFDRIEIAFSTRWASMNAPELTDELRERNRVLANEKNKYLTFFESMSVPMVLLDSHGLVDNVNVAASKILLGKDVPGSYYYSRDQMELPESGLGVAVREFLGSDESVRSEELTLPTQDGPRCFVVTMQRMADVSDKSTGAAVVLADVTVGHTREIGLEQAVDARTRELRDSLAELAKVVETRDRFMASMSHDLRTPLNSIIGFSGLLMAGAAGELNEEQRRQVEMVNASGRHLLAVVNDLLEISRMDAADMNLTTDEVDVLALVRRVLEQHRAAAEAKGLALELSAEDGDYLVISDGTRVTQVLSNIVENGVKFTGDGYVRVSVRDLGSAGVEIVVSDSGPGISPSEAEHLFQAYSRVGTPETPDNPGATGLGLPLARRMCRLLRGSVQVSSTVGRGSVFTVRLPRSCESPATMSV